MVKLARICITILVVITAPIWAIVLAIYEIVKFIHEETEYRVTDPFFRWLKKLERRKRDKGTD